MAKKGERPNGTTRFGEGFVWENKETREDDWWQVRRTQDEGSEYNWLCMANKLMYDIMDEVSTVVIWLKLKSRYMSKSFTNKLNLKRNFMGLRW